MDAYQSLPRDQDQKHIITRSTFRNCGVPVNGKGCNGSSSTGCQSGSTVFSFLTHSSEFNPEIMQGTRDIVLENCGRRVTMLDFRGPGYVSVSARLQNWIDADGSVTGLNESSAIASAIDNGLWWKIDQETIYDSEGPVYMFSLASGLQRGLGHLRLYFDYAQHNQVGSTICTNGGLEPCPTLGYIKHVGPMFAADSGLKVTAQADIAGPVGGFGWLLKLTNGAPKLLRLELIELRPDTPLVLHVAYPPGTTFTITATAPYCGNGGCSENFHQVGSVDEVRKSLGNTYYMSPSGLLSIRIIQFSGSWLGGGTWILPDYDTRFPWNQNAYVLDRFERDGVLLPRMEYGPFLEIRASCSGTTYCTQKPQDLNLDPCPAGFSQVAFDKCCSGTQCVCSNGSPC
jgi:hypothetical protein